MKPIKPIKLSICIVGLASRASMLFTLIEMLRTQARFDECELLILMDSGAALTGDKRNRVLDAARGQYASCIDDDDDVAFDYVPRILEAIDENPGVDAIAIRGHCTQTNGHECDFDYRLGGIEGEWINNTIWRSPGHLCPIRIDIARQVSFPTPTHGEDLAWSAQLAPLLKTCARASSKLTKNGELYFYRLDATKITPRVIYVDRSHQEIFTPQYRRASGPGSTIGYSQPYRKWLQQFIYEHEIKSIFDLGCGDMTVMGGMDLAGIEYIGFDVIAARIADNRERFPDLMFGCEDLRRMPLDADLIICKDVLQHWSNAEVSEWLDRLQSLRLCFKYALITNCNYGNTVNQTIPTGSWRAIDLTKPPFSTGEVIFQWGDAIGGYKDVVLVRGDRS